MIMLLVCLVALTLPPVLAMQGKAYRGAYGAVAFLSLLFSFFVGSPWPKGDTPEAQMVSDFMNLWRGEFALAFLTITIGAILGAMLWRAPSLPQSSAPSGRSDRPAST